jgi:hypothetical protein
MDLRNGLYVNVERTIKIILLKSLPSLQEANKWINKNFMRLDNTYSKNPEDYHAYVRKQ